MKEWFYVKHPDGRRMVYRTDVVVGVRETDTGVMILFKDEGQVATDTYDLASFISNVLEENDLLKALDDSADRRMVSDKDIYRSANLMIHQHGDGSINPGLTVE